MRKNKYNNKKYYWDGMCFDSKKEYNHYIELKHRAEKLNEFKLIVKPIFELIPKFRYEDKAIRRATIQPDFMLIHNEKVNGARIYEIRDVKGFDKKKNKFRTTEKFDLQWKLLKFYAYIGDLNRYEHDKKVYDIFELMEWRFTLI